MKVISSTSMVHPRDRLAYWREETTKTFVAHDFSTPLRQNFDGEISVASLGNVKLAAFRCDAARAVHSERHLRSANDDDVHLFRHSSGRMTVHQDGRDVAARSGDVYILDPRRPFTIGIASKAEAIVFKIPRSELQARLGEIGSYTATLLPRTEPSTALASEFLAMLEARADAIDASIGAKVAQQALDLVALAFETGVGGAAQLSSTRTTKLLRLKSIIEGRLHDPELKPADVSAIAGISVRYANALLAHEGTSLERYITFRRLVRCHQALQSTANLSRTVGDIAFSFGFSDLSHFTRRYKAQFGRSPSEDRSRLVTPPA
jgi:AraC family transcriptional activator of tynA and feaB